MSYPFKIAWRYFFSKSNQTVINRINAFAFFMVVVASSTLFIVLSAFSGLKDFSLSFSNTFDPDFEIKPERGSYFIVSNEALNQIEKIPQILVNITVKDNEIIRRPSVKKSIKIANRLIKNQGRILVRKSGTEQKIRIMGESKNKVLLKKCINLISKTIK